MTHLWKKNINEATHQKLRNKDIYESDMHKIYNLIVVQTHEQLQEKATPDKTLQAFKSEREPIGYLIILKRLYFSNKSEQKTIRWIWMAIMCMYNIM